MVFVMEMWCFLWGRNNFSIFLSDEILSFFAEVLAGSPLVSGKCATGQLYIGFLDFLFSSGMC